jgi:hypothetical protein
MEEQYIVFDILFLAEAVSWSGRPLSGVPQVSDVAVVIVAPPGYAAGDR